MSYHIYVGEENKHYTMPLAFKYLSSLFASKEPNEFNLKNTEHDTFENYIKFLSNFYDEKSNKYIFPNNVEEAYPYLHPQNYDEFMILSNYLYIPEVLNICCSYMIYLIRGKSPKEIRQFMTEQNILQKKN